MALLDEATTQPYDWSIWTSIWR